MNAARPALGCRVKSGRAIAIVLDGPASAPRALLRRELVLCDPKTPATKQPYHSAVGEAETDERNIRARVAIIERCAAEAVGDLLSTMAAAPARACLVVGSVTDPQTIANQHMRAHGNEGRIFRVVLEQALAKRGIDAVTLVEKKLKDEAAARALPPQRVAAAMDQFGKTLGRPWTADEKAAALAAWIVLAGEPPS